MNIGVNTFGLRGMLYKDFDGALADLKNAGVDALEVCVAFPSNKDAMPDFPVDPDSDIMTGGIWSLESAPEKIAKVRAAGLKVVGVHPMCFYREPGELAALVPLMKKFAEENDIRYYVNSPMRNASEIVDFVPMFQEISESLAADGITFMIHNHEPEVKVINGKSALDIVLEAAPKLKLELDVGWALFGGADPVELMERYKKQLGIIHFKDIMEGACEENRDRCFTAVGEGAIPLKEIVQKGVELGLGEDCMVIDQDDSSGDMLTDIENGVKNIRIWI